jgi:hypothetical protein
MKTQEDWETRMENVQELITFASDVEVGPSVARDEAAGEGAEYGSSLPMHEHH